MRLLSMVAAVLVLVALIRFSPITSAQTPPSTPQIITIPGRATLAPGESATFRRRSGGATLTVFYGGPSERATVTYDGTVLIAGVPPLGAFESLSGGDLCARVDGQSHVLRCTVQPTREGARVSIGILHADPVFPFTPSPGSALSVAPLAAGCNNVTLTFPDGASVAAIARSILSDTPPPPPSVLASRARPKGVWKLDPSRQRFAGWSPLPDAPNDLERVNRMDPVLICMDGPGQLVQPALP